MKEEKNIDWFKQEITPFLQSYTLEYRFYEEGDFGSLDQVNFNSDTIGGNVDFWGLGWLGILVWDYQEDRQLLNILLEPNKEEEKEEAFRRLKELIVK